jgi:hypothetical protein
MRCGSSSRRTRRGKHLIHSIFDAARDGHDGRTQTSHRSFAIDANILLRGEVGVHGPGPSADRDIPTRRSPDTESDDRVPPSGAGRNAQPADRRNFEFDAFRVQRIRPPIVGREFRRCDIQPPGGL